MSDRDDLPKPDVRPRVVIDWDEHRRQTIYADDGVDVFDRTIHHPDDVLYRYSPAPIPEGWLDGAIGYKGDGSWAEQCAIVMAETLVQEEREGKVVPARKPIQRH